MGAVAHGQSGPVWVRQPCRAWRSTPHPERMASTGCASSPARHAACCGCCLELLYDPTRRSRSTRAWRRSWCPSRGPACGTGRCPCVSAARVSAVRSLVRDRPPDAGGDREAGAYLHQYTRTKIVQHTPVPGRHSPDDPALTHCWADRRRRRQPHNRSPPPTWSAAGGRGEQAALTERLQALSSRTVGRECRCRWRGTRPAPAERGLPLSARRSRSAHPWPAPCRRPRGEARRRCTRRRARWAPAARRGRSSTGARRRRVAAAARRSPTR